MSSDSFGLAIGAGMLTAVPCALLAWRLFCAGNNSSVYSWLGGGRKPAFRRYWAMVATCLASLMVVLIRSEEFIQLLFEDLSKNDRESTAWGILVGFVCCSYFMLALPTPYDDDAKLEELDQIKNQFSDQGIRAIKIAVLALMIVSAIAIWLDYHWGLVAG